MNADAVVYGADGSRISRAFLKIARETLRTVMDSDAFVSAKLDRPLKLQLKSVFEIRMD